jgi:cysteine desulfuration protein SufE
MTHPHEVVPPRLKEIIEDFQLSQGQEKVELLLYYSERMPPLPPHLSQHHEDMQQVEECMTPVFVKAEIEDGGMHFYFDVPPESPTVRGFAAIMAEGLDGATPEQILTIPNDFFQQMGLEQILTIQRLNGLSAILAHVKRLAAQALDQPL